MVLWPPSTSLCGTWLRTNQGSAGLCSHSRRHQSARRPAEAPRPHLEGENSPELCASEPPLRCRCPSPLPELPLQSRRPPSVGERQNSLGHTAGALSHKAAALHCLGERSFEDYCSLPEAESHSKPIDIYWALTMCSSCALGTQRWTTRTPWAEGRRSKTKVLVLF